MWPLDPGKQSRLKMRISGNWQAPTMAPSTTARSLFFWMAASCVEACAQATYMGGAEHKHAHCDR